MKHRNFSLVLAVLMAAVTLSSCTVPSDGIGSTISSEPTSSSASSLTSSDLTSVLISSNSVLSEAVSSVAEISSMVTSSKAVVSSKPTASSKVTVSSKPTTTAKKPPASSKVTVSSKPAAPANPWDKMATAEDAELVAERVLYWINVFRQEEGARPVTSLPRQKLVAQLRSEQLTTNFAHDHEDQQKIYSMLQYGEFTGPMENLDGSINPGNWLPHEGEAIGCSPGLVGESIDNDAEYIAWGCRRSEAHWGYVGSDRERYISVGCTAKNGYWYTCILVNDTDKNG